MTEVKVSLARDFSRFPGPRYKSQGPNSAEKFRKHLVNLLKQHDRVIVDLDGTSGIGSSFLDEVFGGLIAVEGFSRKDVELRVAVTSKLDASYLATVKDSVSRAKALAEA